MLIKTEKPILYNFIRWCYILFAVMIEEDESSWLKMPNRPAVFGRLPALINSPIPLDWSASLPPEFCPITFYTCSSSYGRRKIKLTTTTKEQSICQLYKPTDLHYDATFFLLWLLEFLDWQKHLFMFKSLFPSVNFFMSLQVSRSAKTFATLFTFKRLFSSVNSFVNL